MHKDKQLVCPSIESKKAGRFTQFNSKVNLRVAHLQKPGVSFVDRGVSNVDSYRLSAELEKYGMDDSLFALRSGTREGHSDISDATSLAVLYHKPAQVIAAQSPSVLILF